MTDILCRWLNDELGISQPTEPATFARDFSSGYLIGEILHKYQLQDDFDQFSQSRTSESKLNNFSRLERVFGQLGLPFDTALARDVMTEKHGMAARLLYQLYIILNHHQQRKASSAGAAAARHRHHQSIDVNDSVRLNTIEDNRLREHARKQKKAARQSELNLGDSTSRSNAAQRSFEEAPFQDRFLAHERRRKSQEQLRLDMLERSWLLQTKQSEMVAKIRSATMPAPKPPSKSNKLLQEREALRQKRETAETVAAISRFEDKLKMILLPTDDGSDEIDISYILKRDEDRADTLNVVKMSSNSEYIGKIRKRLKEDAAAREEREKRRRKVIGEQLSAHQAQEEARREEMMVNKLMRQSQQERRIAMQLLQARKEKGVIRSNRIAREQQYQERRLRDFEEALNREAELAWQQKEENKEQLQQAQELHDKIAAQRAEERYRRHYDSCYDIIAQVVDFSCKVAEYRQLTENLIPAKLMRDWTAMFVSGHPLYEAVPVDTGEPTPEQILEEERQMLLDEGDFMEYKNMIGEWQPPEGAEMSGPPRSNPVVGHIIQRLYHIVHPPTPPPPPPEFPVFPLRACVLGKPFSGKTTAVKKLLEEHRLLILDVDELVNEAVAAHKNNEMMEATTEPQAVRETSSATDRPSAGQEEELTADAIGNAAEGGGGGGVGGATADLSAVTEEGPASQKSSANQVRRQESRDTIPTKPSSVQRSRDKTKDSNEPQPSVRNKLGSKALKFLKKGRLVDDQIVVDIVADAIKHVPEGTGWVIDGYPQNYNQAKLLEKALTGYDANKEAQKQTAKLKTRKSSLVPDPRPTPPPPSEPTSGIDVVILFDIDDDVCIRRANEQPKTSERDEAFNEESNLLADGSASGAGRQEKVGSVSDPAGDPDQLQQKLVSFQDTWPKMDKWFTRFGTLKKVDAAEQPGALFLEMEKIMEDTVAKILGKDLESSLPLEQTEGEKAEETPETAPAEMATEPQKDASAVAAQDAKPGGSRSGSRVGSPKPPGSRPSSKEERKDSARDKSASPKRPGSGRRSEGKKSSRGSSPKSAKGGKKDSAKKTSLQVPVMEPEEPAGPRTPQPGDEEWEFVDQDLDQTLAYILSSQWEGVENVYVANCKHVFRQVRQERENIYRYFFQIRKDFLSYLRQPDTKQDLVELWQENYNTVPNDMRDDEHTRAELHQRVDDLRERLWTVCDERKDRAELERKTVMTDGWLNDHLGVLTNHYITIMQAELDRFQDTVRLLKDYYRGMDGEIPEELKTQYSRIPLMQLPINKPQSPKKEDKAAAPAATAHEQEGGDREQEAEMVPATPCTLDTETASAPQHSQDRATSRSTQQEGGARSPGGASNVEAAAAPATAAGEAGTEEGQKEAAPPVPPIPVVRIKIPLIPRNGEIPDPENQSPTPPEKDEKGKPEKPSKKGKISDTEPRERDRERERSVPLSRDPDEKFLFGAHRFATKAIAGIMTEEMAAKMEEEEAERIAGQPAKVKGRARGRRIKEPSVELSEEEKLKKELKAKTRFEHYFTIKEEETASCTRLELVKAISMAVVQDLKQKADNAFKDMNDWLGARFLKEMESIDTMSEVMRQAIEEGLPLKERIILEQEDFLMDTDLHMLKTPSPLPVPEPVEELMPDHFTVNQLFRLFKQLRDLAPTGFMSVKAFTEMMESTVSAGSSPDLLPDRWATLTQTQIEELGRTLALDSESLDWRRLLLTLMWPIPTPTQPQLLEALQNFKDMDQRNVGLVTREQFDRTALWFDTVSPYAEGFDRLTAMKKIIFDIFADHSGTLSKLDYTNLLLYFSMVPNSYEGFLRALSVVTGTHMPRIPKPAVSISVMSTEQLEVSASGTAVEESASNLESIEEGKEKPELVEPAMMGEKIPMEAVDNLVSLEDLLRVLHHSEKYDGESHRFSASEPVQKTCKEKLAAVFEDLGNGNLAPLTLRVLMKHPVIQEAVLDCKIFTALDLDHMLTSSHTDDGIIVADQD